MAQTIPTAPVAPTAYRLVAAIGVVALIGFGLSVELTRIHHQTHTNPAFRSLCAISETVNCEAVALSSYSVFLGLPVSVWGMIGYFTIGLLAGISFALRNRAPGYLFGGLLVLTGVSLAASAVLGFISFARIDSVCLFCTGTYAANAVLMALSVLLARRSGRLPVALVRDDLVALVRRPMLTLLLVGVCCAPIGIARAVVTPYWETGGWEHLPILAHGTTAGDTHWMGATSPSLTVEEFTDYECPYCRSAHRAVRELLAKYKDQVRIVHRHFPLDSGCNENVNRPFHQFACRFSLAVECAGQEGKFWEMNDAIFSAQEQMKAKDVNLEHLALRLGLDRGDFKACLEQQQPAPRIHRDVKAGSALGIRATPSFVINGRIHAGRLTEEQLQQALLK